MSCFSSPENVVSVVQVCHTTHHDLSTKNTTTCTQFFKKTQQKRASTSAEKNCVFRTGLRGKTALPNYLIHLTYPVRRLQNLPRLRPIRRPHQAIVVHHVDQMSRPPIPNPKPPLQQGSARLAELIHQPHRIVIQIVVV